MFNTTSLGLGGGGTKIKDLVVGATWLGFHPSPPRYVPSGLTYLHFPESAVSNNGITLGIKSFYLVCSHSRCFGSNFEYSLYVLAKGLLALT